MTTTIPLQPRNQEAVMTFGPAVQMVRMDLETTSATGAIDPRRSRAGFTLIEILLVIGLILLIGSLAIYNVANLTRMRDDRSVEEVLLTAVREARYQASTTKELCWLSYDGEKGTFHISSGGPATALPEPSTQSVFGSLVEDGEEEESAVSASALESFQVYVVEDEDPQKLSFLLFLREQAWMVNPRQIPRIYNFVAYLSTQRVSLCLFK